MDRWPWNVREVIADNAVLRNIPLTSIRDKVRNIIRASQETESVSSALAAHPPTQMESQCDKLRRFGFLPNENGESNDQQKQNDQESNIGFVDHASEKPNTQTSLKD